MKTYILIPTFNRYEILKKTLLSIDDSLNLANKKIIIVDASSDGITKKFLKKNFPSIILLNVNSSFWWTSSINYGLDYISKYAFKGDKVLLLNDDISLDKNSIQNITQASKIRPKSIIGGVNLVANNLNNKTHVYFCGAKYNLFTGKTKIFYPFKSLWEKPQFRFIESDYVYGRFMLIPWEVYLSGIAFDSKFFPQYLADEDFCFSAKKKGHDVLIDTKSIVYVNEDTTTKFSLNYKLTGFRGIMESLTKFNSPYCIKQWFIFTFRHSKFPIFFFLYRYISMFLGENFKK